MPQIQLNQIYIRKNYFKCLIKLNKQFFYSPTMKIAVIGAGVAGSTITLRLTQEFSNIQAILFQANQTIVNGPPICHLHAGGSLYRQISDNECLQLLEECIKTARLYNETINYRPTILSIPLHDPGSPQEIIRRLQIIKNKYNQLVQEDPNNQVLGKPQNYYKVFYQEKMLQLSKRNYPQIPQTFDDWMVPVAKSINFKKFKFPFVLVQQPGWSIMRYAAQMETSLQSQKNCQIKTNTKVVSINKGQSKKWKVTYLSKGQKPQSIQVDYIVNCCGYQTGTIDDMVGLKKNRMVQFKAAYLAKWQECQGVWPQFIIHGVRKTPQGMGQFTPYKGNIFQIHGMTQNITLFPGGLSKTTDESSHPRLQKIFDQILTHGWQQRLLEQRTKAAINYIAQYIPSVKSAKIGGKPLYGAQQIPGKDDKLRTATVSFDIQGYARAQIVKGSSALAAAQKICEQLSKNINQSFEMQKQLVNQSNFETRSQMIERKGIKIAKDRKYPSSLGQYYNYPKL